MAIPNAREYEDMIVAEKEKRSPSDKAKAWAGGIALVAVLAGGPILAQKLHDSLYPHNKAPTPITRTHK